MAVFRDIIQQKRVSIISILPRLQWASLYSARRKII